MFPKIFRIFWSSAFQLLLSPGILHLDEHHRLPGKNPTFFTIVNIYLTVNNSVKIQQRLGTLNFAFNDRRRFWRWLFSRPSLMTTSGLWWRKSWKIRCRNTIRTTRITASPKVKQAYKIYLKNDRLKSQCSVWSQT